MKQIHDESAAGTDGDPPVPAAGSQILKSAFARGSGRMQRTMDWMRTRGVKNWPAPFFPSLAAFSSNQPSADFNADSTIDFFDYLDFVSDFAARRAASDYNADTVIDFFDYLDFVASFAAGESDAGNASPCTTSRWPAPSNASVSVPVTSTHSPPSAR